MAPLLYKMYQPDGTIQWGELMTCLQCETYTLGRTIIPSVATAMFVETLQRLQITTRLNLESLKYKLHTGHETLRTEIHSELVSI
jgi:hypothetical protein